MPKILPTRKFRETGYTDEKIKELAKYKYNGLIRDGYMVVL